jgi:N-sulfoglucosamine sulfohydrolase
MVSTIDILPTILDATGVKTAQSMHGRSLRPVVENHQASWTDYLVAEFHYHGSRPFYPRRAIRDQRFKLIHNLLAGEAKPSTGIDGDPAFRLSQSPPYAGTAIERAFNTFGDPPEFELYDLNDDPIEFFNLAETPQHQATLERLQQALLHYRRQTDDPFLEHGFLVRMQNRRLGQ